MQHVKIAWPAQQSSVAEAELWSSRQGRGCWTQALPVMRSERQAQAATDANNATDTMPEDAVETWRGRWQRT